MGTQCHRPGSIQSISKQPVPGAYGSPNRQAMLGDRRS